ncbi:MAG: GNAT family N-acetyltransferase [Rhodobacteraceae bacterium]|nr:GNAT family N-acetyltransferase [Paracoccaceae bacterium]
MRAACRADVAAVVGLLSDGAGALAERPKDLTAYHGAFDRMQVETGNRVYVGEIGDEVVATYQFAIICGLSLRAARRAQIESVRVRRDLRGRGLGRALMADAETRARAAGCTLLQLTSSAVRAEAQRFYVSLGFTASHVGFKKPLE